MRQWISVSVGLLLAATGFAEAGVFDGAFVNEVVFIDYLEADPPATVLGTPDGLAPDLDGGGITVRFNGTLQGFDYTVAIPSETDLVVIEETGSPDGDPIPTVCFAYDNNPIDADNDGVADGVTATAALLGTAWLWQPYWNPTYDRMLKALSPFWSCHNTQI